MTKENPKKNKSSKTVQSKVESDSSKVKIGAKGTPKSQTRLYELEKKVSSLTESNRHHKRKIFDLYTIFEISRNFNTVLDYHALLDSFIFTSLAQVGATKAAVYLEQNINDEEFAQIKTKGSGSFPKQGTKFKLGTQLTDYISRLNRPSIISELTNGIASNSEKSILKHFDPGLFVPLVYQGRLSGILLISDKISEREFNNDDVEFMSILGNQISVSIENTRLYEAERLLSRQLRETQDQLLQSERLAALGEMSAKVAHEINNPLGIIKNYLHLTASSVDENNDAKKYTNIVEEEINRIARIVKELLEFHRPHRVEMEPTDIAKLINDLIELMERQFDTANITCKKNFNENYPTVMASSENLKQVFLNIIINAYDAMENGGTLGISIKQDKDQLLINICDTGPGIPPELIPRIFEPFFTTKEQGKGTGLGLSVCYGIIKSHNGSIIFENTDEGGCFEIRLPITNNGQR
jgi:signal transduction histidine kinase